MIFVSRPGLSTLLSSFHDAATPCCCTDTPPTLQRGCTVDGLLVACLVCPCTWLPFWCPLLPTEGPPALQEERAANELLDGDEKAAFVPISFDSLRRVPAYASFINERFERCLDLYLCPRTRKKRLDIDPESLVPRLPKPADLQPFPTTLLLRYIGHTGRVSRDDMLCMHNVLLSPLPAEPIQPQCSC